jgi:hypothetical protein
MALIELLHRTPLWLLAIVLNAWLIGTALVGIRIARRHVIPRLGLKYDDAYYGAALVQSAMLLYGLIAALTAVGVWSKYSETSDVVSAEATAIAILWRDFGGYPEPERSALRDGLREYTDQVINRAWPELRAGRTPTEGVSLMDDLQLRLFAFEPATSGQAAIHGETLGAFNLLVEQRRLRLDAAQTDLPGVLWIVLLAGAMGCITLCLLFHVESAGFQEILLVGVAASLAMVLLVIFALDTPFTGDMGIGPDSYQLVYDQHMR